LNTPITEIQTPAFLVDYDVLVRNCDTMRAKAERSQVSFRPHVKTHKVPEIGRLQHGGMLGPITVSTLAEAEHFADAGFEDITWAVPVAPDKLDRAAELAGRIRTLNILVDTPGAVDAIEEFADSRNLRFDVFLKVDCGYHRAGVDPDDPSSMQLALRIAGSRAMRFRGLLTHAGHSYQAAGRPEILSIAVVEAGAVDGFARRLSESGIGSLIRSVGSTPTASLVESFEHVDEVRPGNYVFYDAFQSTLGSCSLEDCAATVLASVIGIYREQNRLMIDAGALALSKDSGPQHLVPDFGYGLVCDPGMKRLPLRIDSLSQEHGKVTVTGAFDFERFPVGSKLRIIPNHSCLTAAMFDVYHVVRNGSIVDEWRPARGW
jgi:D-serine deaminase-like pyridoxal phosphate-dependent protein